ncbi:MAG: WYL domain-containing protein [Clostridia bacterium]|nr:WYL domain-containing protein [Clostridia bacterium]
MAYSELIKSFEKIRDYMREFYVYGFKQRGDYTKKSPRSYDDVRRRVDSYLGDFMSFSRTVDGKSVFLSIDTRNLQSNPLYSALKAKSFTDKDITLHFILFDILCSPEICLTQNQLTERIIDDYLSKFEDVSLFDESTLRKKLREYEAQGLIVSQKRGKALYYRRADTTHLPPLKEALAFFSETLSCGALGAFILEKTDTPPHIFSFKHHYITRVLDSDILLSALLAIYERQEILVQTCSKKKTEPTSLWVVPICVFQGTQNGRSYLMSYDLNNKKIVPLRIDYILKITTLGKCQSFDKIRQDFDSMRPHMWGVTTKKDKSATEYVEFVVQVNEGEDYIYKRMLREKRCGTVEVLDEGHIKFSAHLYDSWEIVPWIRTFIHRITKIHFENKHVERQFYEDLRSMQALYSEQTPSSLGEGEGYDDF